MTSDATKSAAIIELSTRAQAFIDDHRASRDLFMRAAAPTLIVLSLS